jgi:hypothetical protein
MSMCNYLSRRGLRNFTLSAVTVAIVSSSSSIAATQADPFGAAATGPSWSERAKTAVSNMDPGWFAREIPIKAPVATPAPVDAELERSGSYVLLSARMPLEAIEQRVNTAFAGNQRLAGARSDPTDLLLQDTLHWSATVAPVRVFDAGAGRIGFETTVRGKATVEGKVKVETKVKKYLGGLGGLFDWVVKQVPGVPVSETVDFAGTARVTLLPTLRGDLTLDPGLTVSVHVAEAKMKLVGKLIPLSLSGEVQKAVDKKLPDMTAELSKQITATLNLREATHKAWNNMSKPIRLAQAPAAWLQIKPAELMLADPRVVDGELRIDVGMRSVVSVSTTEPPARSFGSPVLRKAPLDPNGGTFSVSIPASASFADLTKASRSLLARHGGEFRVGKGRVNVNDVSFGSIGDRVLVRVNIVASYGSLFERIRGSLYLTGRPVLEAGGKVLRVEELDYEVQTRNVLVGAADWLLHPAFVQQLQKLAVLNIAAMERRAIQEAGDQVEEFKRQVPRGLQVDFGLSGLAVDDVRVHNNALRLVVTAKGKANLVIDNVIDPMRAQ